MKEKIINKEDFLTTKWSGGETTQLSIYPEDAIFAERDFLWRISSATFTSKESRFSDFSSYQRYILPLEGKISLFHEGLYNRKLDKYEAEYFDGSWNTFSTNTLDCRDYNFIVKSGSDAKMQILSIEDKYFLHDSKIVTMFSMNDFIVTLEEKGIKRNIDGFSLFVLETNKELEMEIIKASTPVILTEFSIK
ncbi:MAG: HutD family protein [Tissierella sp.]|uniref:HutD family protein n=1 Tax=Tissierella sp. TaxID=41274 RepID=UPI003F9717D4